MGKLAAQQIRAIRAYRHVWGHIVEPFVERSQDVSSGCSFGLSSCGYDIRLDQRIVLGPSNCVDSFKIASSLEHFSMPDDVMAVVHDKSTWARRGLSVFNTVIEPGWRGWLTLELRNNGPHTLVLEAGWPIAQVVFDRLEVETEQPYPESGKYQDQERGPQGAR